MKRLIAFISILMLASVVSGTSVSITIYGTNKSNAQDNITCYGCNNTISVQAWNTSYVKNFTVYTANASGDVISFNISNVTAYRVQELKVNGTAINAYQAGANGMLNFTYTVVGNRTLVLSPASNVNGYNFTWSWFWNLTANRFNDTDNTAYFIDPSSTGTSALFAGNVGIGTTGPTEKLDVAGTIVISGAGGASNTKINIRASGNDRIDNIPTSGNYYWQINGGTKAILDVDGNLGIGTTTPATKLHVVGTINGTNLEGNGSGLTIINAFTTQYTRPCVQGTVYQNTNITPLVLNVWTYRSGASVTLRILTDSSNPPTTLVTANGWVGSSEYNLTASAVILANNYYMIPEITTPTSTNCVLWR